MFLSCFVQAPGRQGCAFSNYESLLSFRDVVGFSPIAGQACVVCHAVLEKANSVRALNHLKFCPWNSYKWTWPLANTGQRREQARGKCFCPCWNDQLSLRANKRRAQNCRICGDKQTALFSPQKRVSPCCMLTIVSYICKVVCVPGKNPLG